MSNILLKKGFVTGICLIIVILCFSLTSIGISLNNANTNISGKKTIKNNENIFSFWKMNLYGISFINTDIGTVVGDNGIILHTDDGGKTWFRQNTVKNLQTYIINSRLWDVSFFNKNIGMAVGWDGTVIYTNNSGNKWNVANTRDMLAFYSAQMLTSTIGFSAGVNSIFQPMIFRTNDCWQTYDVIIFYPEHGGSSYEADLTDICFINISKGFSTARIFNGEGAICRSNDSGYTWDTIYWGNNCLNGITFPSENVGYAVGDFGQIVKTTDSGVSWTELDSITNKDLYAVSFPSEDTGNAVGKNGIILRTEDNGSTWFIQNSGTTKNLNKVQFLDSENGFAVGDGGIVLHTEDGGNSWFVKNKNLNKQIYTEQYIWCLRLQFKLLSGFKWSLFSIL
jgi:photosystem II stability/assembly factor-like uncharacterized protein